MYKLFLILKYLRKRRIAWVSLVAVTLCTAMVIVVMSVMGGWLNMFRQSYRGLTGDITIARRSWTGFPYYQEIIDELQKDPRIKAAVPTLQTYGLINIDNQIRAGVQVIGYPIDRIGLVNNFPQSLYRQYGASQDPSLSPDERAAAAKVSAKAPDYLLPDGFKPPLSPDVYRAMVPNAKSDVSKWPGLIVGGGVIGIRKNKDGTSSRPSFLTETWAKLTVMGMDDKTSFADVGAMKAEKNYWIVDDSRTKIYQQDESTVYVPFDVLQQELRMGADTETDINTNQKTEIPARTTNIQVAVKPGVNSAEMVAPIQQIVDNILAAHNYNGGRSTVEVKTWEQQQAKFINAIEKEIVLTTGLFAIISVVAVFLIFVIFYMIVVEKTKDIGIIKSVGATGEGVAAIFIGYGLAIGLVGGGLGLLSGYLVVHNINQLHTWLGELLGVQMWDPETYMFDTIPNTLDPGKVSVIVAVAVVSSVVGSLIPAIRAARMNPIEALRWE